MASKSYQLPILMQSAISVSALYLRELIPSVNNEILQQAGISNTRLRQDAHYRVPMYKASRLLTLLSSLNNDPLLALRHAHTLSLKAFPLLGLSVLASTTLEQGLRRLIELDGLIWNAVEIRLEKPQSSSATAALIMTPRLPLPPTIIELAMAGWVLLGPTLWQINEPKYRVSFCHIPRSETAAYEQLFGCAVQFQAEHNAVYFPASWLEHTLPFADPGASETILHAARRQLAQPLQQNLENHIRSVCFQALPGPLPDLINIAELLQLPARQLRQWLNEQQLHLRDIQDQVRQEAALYWLQQSERDLADLANACGFSEQSAFQRAFKRWTGFSPGQWQLLHRQDLP